MEAILVSEETKLKVKRGAYLLAEHGITDLSHYVNLNILDLGDSESCVLGQTYGGYDEGAYQLNLNDDEAVGMGFLADADSTTSVISKKYGDSVSTERSAARREQYVELTAAWREYLS